MHFLSIIKFITWYCWCWRESMEGLWNISFLKLLPCLCFNSSESFLFFLKIYTFSVAILHLFHSFLTNICIFLISFRLAATIFLFDKKVLVFLAFSEITCFVWKLIKEKLEIKTLTHLEHMLISILYNHKKFAYHIMTWLGLKTKSHVP